MAVVKTFTIQLVANEHPYSSDCSQCDMQSKESGYCAVDAGFKCDNGTFFKVVKEPQTFFCFECGKQKKVEFIAHSGGKTGKNKICSACFHERKRRNQKMTNKSVEFLVGIK